MAAYPSYDILLGSSIEEESGVEDDFAETGTMHSRLYHSEPFFRFQLQHALTLAQYNSLKATYTAGRRDVHTLTYFTESPQVTYSVQFTGPPVIVGNVGGDLYFVNVPLRGTKD